MFDRTSKLVMQVEIRHSGRDRGRNTRFGQNDQHPSHVKTLLAVRSYLNRCSFTINILSIYARRTNPDQEELFDQVQHYY